MGNDLKARYQVYKDVGDKYRFRLRATNNKIVVVSEAYESKQACKQGIEAVKKNCGADIEDLTTTKSNEKRTEKTAEHCSGSEETQSGYMFGEPTLERGPFRDGTKQIARDLAKNNTAIVFIKHIDGYNDMIFPVPKRQIVQMYCMMSKDE